MPKMTKVQIQATPSDVAVFTWTDLRGEIITLPLSDILLGVEENYVNQDIIKAKGTDVIMVPMTKQEAIDYYKVNTPQKLTASVQEMEQEIAIDKEKLEYSQKLLESKKEIFGIEVLKSDIDESESE